MIIVTGTHTYYKAENGDIAILTEDITKEMDYDTLEHYVTATGLLNEFLSEDLDKRSPDS